MKQFSKTNSTFSLRTLFNLLRSNINTADFKATINSIVIPVVLFFSTGTLLSSIIWVLFVCYIYKFQKVNTENGRVFFEYISFILTILSILIFIVALIFITVVL